MISHAVPKAGWRRDAKRTMVALMAVTLPLLGVVAPPAGAATLGVGPVDSATGFPLWVAAGADRLDLCLDDPSCLGTSTGLVPAEGEAFWFNATATLAGHTPGLVEMATEAAFAADGPGQQIAFNRLRIRLDVPAPGTYRVDYPYGSKTFTVTAVSDVGKEINLTQDVGCLTAPCNAFGELAGSGDGGVDGSFLTWDPSVGPAAPEGFIGDGLSEHKVVGSPIGRNFVEVVRTDLASPQTITHVDTFAVQGRIARPRVLASPTPGSYATSQSVVLRASEPGADIRYTTDGSSPTDAAGNVVARALTYSTPIAVDSDTTITAVNVLNGVAVTDPVTRQPSAPSVFRYVIDRAAPSLAVDPATGSYASAQLVTMSPTDDKDPAAKVYYTLGTGTAPPDPTPSSTPYTGPVPVNGNSDGARTFVKAIAVDAAGNRSAVVQRTYTVNAPDVSASPAGGSYAAAVDVRLSATDPEAKIYYNTAGADPVVHQDATTGAVTGVDDGVLYVNDPIHLTGDSMLKFVAVSPLGHSTVKTESYLVDIPANRPPGALGSRGPVDTTVGYPFWYGDRGGTSSSLAPARLELCLDDPLCPVRGDLPDPTKPLSYPDNFPDESFWWSGEAAIDVAGGPSSLLVLSQEAAFGGAGTVVPGEQISFARLRIRLDDVVPGETYTVTSPYGVDVVTADDRGRARMTEDVGCLAAPCTWREALDGRIGPFLRWDPAVAPAAPAGYVGNPLVEHKVVGSPHGTNFFRVEGPNVGGPGVDRVETDLFTVQGRLAQLRATATPGGGLFSAPQDVTVQASFPAEAEIVWTNDGSDPAVDPATGAVTNGQALVPATGDENAKAVVHVPDGRTTLKFMGVDLASHKASQIYTEEYAVEGALPTVTATPDPAAGPFPGLQQVTLTSTGQAVFYTTDGTTPKLDASGNPTGTTTRFEGTIRVGRPTTVKAAAVSLLGSLGPVATFVYDVHNLKSVGPVDAANGYPAWFEDHGSGALPPVRLQLCLDDPSCPVVGDRPDPTAPVSFPSNFPDESFWWSGGADFAVGAGRARLTLATEAAFASPAVQPGQQIAFSRIRVRADSLVPGATYKVTHPYGDLELTADAAGVINSTDDNGCLAAPCDFSQVLRAPIGPFLRWTGTDAPAGYVGDGVTPHPVTGSPYGTNTFRIEQVTDASGSALASPSVVGETDRFVVQGKLAALQASASPAGGTYTAGQQVTLSSSDAAAAIFYTTDGSTPTAGSARYTGPITIGNEGTTVLKLVAIADGLTSPVVTQTYLIDTVAPTVAMNPNGGTFTAAQSVTITSDDADASIYYTTDGSTPTAGSARYTGPVTVSRSLTLRARAIDAAGNVGGTASASFTIGLPTSTLTLGTPTPATVTIGEPTTLAGALSSGVSPQAGKAVTVQSRALGSSTWVDVTGKTVDTDTNGRYTVGLSPTATADYRVVFGGDGSAQAAASAAQRVQVRARLTLNAPNPSRVSRGRNVTYSGTLAPTHTGARITITVTATGQKPLTASATVAANGTWAVTTRAPGKEGSWKVAAAWGGDADHLAPLTVTQPLTVVK